MTAVTPPSDLFHFGTKAETLERLAGRLDKARLCEQDVLEVSAWAVERHRLVSAILARFAGRRLVVRSSAANEDGFSASMAGAYHSVVGVAPEAAALMAAVDRVISSYGDPSPGDQVLIQPMVENVALSGVVLTRDLETGGPYYVLNYDDISGRTDTVTGGGESKTVLIHHGRLEAIHSSRMRKIIETVRDLEAITRHRDLDVEFCMTVDEVLHILQVRPLAASAQWEGVETRDGSAVLDDIRGFLAKRMAPADGLAGTTTVLGEMPDWNPAEMIGNSPRPLALSLYKSLVTDRSWWRARAAMGYRRVEHPLLIDLSGRPYIDVRLSLNSFLPASLPGDTAGRLVDAQLKRLISHPEAHDKIEFEIAVTCLDFSYAAHAARLAADGVPAADLDLLRESLRSLMDRCLKAQGDGILGLLDRTRALDGKGELVHLLDQCRTEGVEPFAQLARHAFIGMTLLKSLVTRGALSPEDADLFLQSNQTVAGEFVHDLHAVSIGLKSREDFLARYGHLRPGTYDILSHRYDEQPELYLGRHCHAPEPHPPFKLNAKARHAIESLLAETGLALSTEQLLAYILEAVAAREEAKFNFTRNLSNALSALVLWGESLGLEREDVSFLSIDDILAHPDRARAHDLVAAGRERFARTSIIRLPHLLTEPDDIDVVRLPLGRPTFITSKTANAATVRLAADAVGDIDGRIVLIESADPGYDWIFSYGIAGLVTKYGGANSHMAIRCAEFGLPAAIGCGERLFNILAKGRAIELNCAASTVRVVDSLR
jgi:hypothetical protein